MKNINHDVSKTDLIKWLQEQENITEEQIEIIMSKVRVLSRAVLNDVKNTITESADILARYL